MAGVGEGVGQQPQHVAHQHEEEQREDEREEALALRADAADRHGHDAGIGDLGQRLQPARHDRARPHAVIEREQHQRGADHHHQVGVGEVDRPAERAERMVQLELAQRVDLRWCCLGRQTRPLYPSCPGFFPARGIISRQTFAMPAAPPSNTNRRQQPGLGPQPPVQSPADRDPDRERRDQLDPRPARRCPSGSPCRPCRGTEAACPPPASPAPPAAAPRRSRLVGHSSPPLARPSGRAARARAC